MKRQFFQTIILRSSLALGAIVLSWGLITPSAESQPNNTISVYRSPNCGCCQGWIKHLQEAGFKVKDYVTENLDNIKDKYDIPEKLITCHTATTNGYIIEGHVPAQEIQKILQTKPNIAGLGVPGMPIGSPGMESGNYFEPYTVFAFTKNGQLQKFAKYH